MEWFRFTRLNADCANRPKLSYVVLLNMWPGNRGLHFTQRLTTLTEWGKKKNILKHIPKSPLFEKQCLLTNLSHFDPESLFPSDFHCGESRIPVLGTAPHQ